MNKIIAVENISKEFVLIDKKQSFVKKLLWPNKTIKHAVNNISFNLNKGDFVGFLGPNGAGKSTTIKMLTGILTPTNGTITVNNIVPYENRKLNAQNIGVVFGQRTQLWWDLPPEDSFRLLKKIYKIEDKLYKHNLAKFTKILDLQSFMATPVRKLSLGQKMRCELAAALLHSPEVLFLDEPTIGLDLFAKDAIRNFLKEINTEQGTTILLTTHDLDDVENLCNRLIVIDNGIIIEDNSLENVVKSFGNEKVLAFEIASDETLKLPIDCNLVKSENSTHQISFTTRKIPEVIKDMLETHNVHDISFLPLDINEIVKRIYQKSLTSN